MTEQSPTIQEQQTNDAPLENFELEKIQEMMTEFKTRIDAGAERYKNPMQLIEYVMTLLINTNVQTLVNFFIAIDLHKDENRTLKQNVILEYVTQMSASALDMAKKSHAEWNIKNVIPQASGSLQ